MRKTDREMHLWPGYCPTHMKIGVEDVARQKARYPDGDVVVHPECRPDVIDAAIFQDSEESYLSLAMKYRRLTRGIAKRIPVDIIPIKSSASNNSFLSEIEAGEIIYER